MTWTHAYPKEVNLDVYRKYNKIIDIILSCTTLKHIDSCEQVIYNFEEWCIKTRTPYNIYKVLINSINFYLNLQKNKIRLP